MSLIKIGKLLGYSSRTIEIRAKECKIKLRKPGNIPPKISNKTLKKLYIVKRMSSRKIAKIYDCSYSYIDSRIIKLAIPRRNLSTSHIQTRRRDFSGNLQEKAYLIGFRLGDLRSRKKYKKSETILVDCGSTKPAQIKLIYKLFHKYGRVWISQPKSNGKIQIECGLNKSFSFLLSNYEVFPQWIGVNRKLILSAMAGFIDAEGCFFVSKKRVSAAFSLGNYNKKILKQIKKWLEKLRLKTRFFMGVKKGYKGKDGYQHRQDYWMLTIGRKSDLYQFIEIILPYLKHKDRIKDAKRVLENISYRNKKFGPKDVG